MRTATLAANLIREMSDPLASARIDHYLSSGCFTGPRFDTVANDSEEFDANDLLAAASLSITINLTGGRGAIPIGKAFSLIKDAEASALLAAIPHTPMHEVSLANYEAFLGPQSASERLWRRLHLFHGIPQTATYKLVARKRPALLPVRDSVIRKRLYGGGAWWRALHSVLLADGAQQVEAMRRTTAHGQDLPLLRILDIAVWMAGTQGDTCSQCRDPFRAVR